MFKLPSRLAAALALTAQPAPRGDRRRASDQPAVQQALDRVVAAGAPGAIALADGHVSVRRPIADLGSRRPLRADHRIRIGSVTKSFVAVVALQLVGEGRLRLDDTVGARLPGVLPYGRWRDAAPAARSTRLACPTTCRPSYRGSSLGDPLRVWTPRVS